MPIPSEIPIIKHFHSDATEEIHKYVFQRLEALKRSLNDIREEKITQWRRIYYGMPREKTKSFPFQNASNLVVQLVGAFTDQLKAKILMSTFGIDPLFDVQLVGEWDRKEKSEEQKQAVQDWLIYSALEPDHLNLLPKYEAWVSSIIRYGRGTMKLMPEQVIEKVAVSKSGGTVTFTDRIRHDGPVAHPLIFEDFLMPLTIAEVTRSPFNAQRSRLSRFELEAMKYDPTYDKAAIEATLKEPDRHGPDTTTRDIETDQGANGGEGGEEYAAEWDIYECWYPYSRNGQRFQLITTVHLQTKSVLKSVFNWLPENSIPFHVGILGYDGERSTGFGFCEMLKDYQEEVSAIHNRRGDASTLANTNIFRTAPGTQLDSQFSIFPNAIFSGEDGSLEAIPLGRQANETIKDEQISLQLATDRAGVGPSASGQGAGTVNKKNAYSAAGTYSIMQEGDTRANLNKTEFRQAHYLLGRQKLLYDAHFGVSEEVIAAFGKQGEYLKSALANVRKKKIILPIRAATGSINKEVEKQNLMLMLNNVRAHWQMVSQMLQAAENPMLSPTQRDYMLRTIIAGNGLMTRILKEFNINDPTFVLPEPAGIEQESDQLHDQVLQQKAQQMMGAMQQRMQQLQLQQPPPKGELGEEGNAASRPTTVNPI